jgi:hypothetical protein
MAEGVGFNVDGAGIDRERIFLVSPDAKNGSDSFR